MKKVLKIFLILILVAGVVGAGFWFKKDILKFFDNFKIQVQELNKIDIESVVSEVGKEVLTATPLKVGGESNEVTLLKSKIIEETNKQRVANGLPVLTENSLLYQAAAAKSNDMFKNQYFEHTSPSGIDPGTLVLGHGYEYIITGENLILGNFESETEMVDDWMNSPGHRANILNISYTEIGVAVIKGTYEGQTVWIGVQEFGLPLSACEEPSEDLKNEIDERQQELSQLNFILDEKKTEIENTNKKVSYYNDLVGYYNETVKKYNSLAQELKNKISIYNQQADSFNECIIVAQGEK